MTTDVTIKEVPDELVASIRERIDLAEAGARIPDAFRRLWDCAEQAGHGEGTPGMVSLAMEDGLADLELFVPVAHTFASRGDITARMLRGGRMATTTHTGPYNEVGPSYATLAGWIVEHGHRIVGPPRERYLNDPNVVGANKAETEVEFPIEP